MNIRRLDKPTVIRDRNGAFQFDIRVPTGRGGGGGGGVEEEEEKEALDKQPNTKPPTDAGQSILTFIKELAPIKVLPSKVQQGFPAAAYAGKCRRARAWFRADT